MEGNWGRPYCQGKTLRFRDALLSFSFSPFLQVFASPSRRCPSSTRTLSAQASYPQAPRSEDPLGRDHIHPGM